MNMVIRILIALFTLLSSASTTWGSAVCDVDGAYDFVFLEKGDDAEATNNPDLEHADVEAKSDDEEATLTVFDLPLEIMEFTIDKLNPDDVYALRLSSKWGRAMAETEFRKLVLKSEAYWKTRYENVFGPIQNCSDVSRTYSLVAPYLCFLGIATVEQQPERICWREKFHEKSRSVSSSNTRWARYLAWTSENRKERYFFLADFSFFEPSSLTRLDFSGGEFTGARFESTDMSGMDLSRATFKNVNARRACLARKVDSLGGRRVLPFDRIVKLYGADISGADFREAFRFDPMSTITLYGLKMLGCTWDEKNPPRVSP